MKKMNPTLKTVNTPVLFWGFMALLVIVYTAVVGSCYPGILRMMEGNSWVDSWIDNWVLHLFRWPYVGAFLMALFVVGIPVIFIVLYRLRFRRRHLSLWAAVPAVLFMAWFCPPNAGYGEARERYTLFSRQMNVEEQFYRYMFMAEDNDWEGLLEQIRKDDAVDTPIGMRYALLAESALGRLPYNLFRYRVTSPDDFLMRGERNPISCTFNRQFYANLGVYDEAFHQAMEYGLLQKEGCCLFTLRQLIDYSLKEGDARIAEKYLAILGQCRFDRDYVQECRKRLTDIKAGRVETPGSEIHPLREDNFVGVYPLRSEMVRLAYYSVGDSQKTVDYMLCSILLQKQLGQFHSTLSQFPNYEGRELPAIYREALDILQSNETAHRDAQPGTYAYYYYNVTPIEEQTPEMKGRD